jgi:hypothetical protein
MAAMGKKKSSNPATSSGKDEANTLDEYSIEYGE